MARSYTIQCSLSNTHTVYIELDRGRQASREERGRMEGGSKGRVGGGARGGSEETMLCGRVGGEWRKGGWFEEVNE